MGGKENDKDRKGKEKKRWRKAKKRRRKGKESRKLPINHEFAFFFNLSYENNPQLYCGSSRAIPWASRNDNNALLSIFLVYSV